MSTVISVPKAYFIALFCEAIMHGIYTIIFAGAMFLLLRKNTQSRTHKVFISLMLLMYSISTVHISLSLRQSLIAFFEEDATNGGLTTFNDPSSPFLIGQTSLELVNCLIGDSIVAWRAWVLWGGGIGIIVLPAALILTGAVTGSLMVHAYVTSPVSAVLYNSNTTQWVEVFGAVTFSANIYAIGIIAYKAWQHEKAMHGLWSSGGKFHRMLLIVIESGSLYCLILVVIVVLIGVGNDFGVIVVIDILAHLTGIYPSLILILITAQMAYSDKIQRDTEMTSMQFRSPAQGRRGGRRHVNAMGQDSYALDTMTVDLRLGASPESSGNPYPSTTEDETLSSRKFASSKDAIMAKV